MTRTLGHFMRLTSQEQGADRAETAKALIEKLDRCLLFLNQLLLEMRRNVRGKKIIRLKNRLSLNLSIIDVSSVMRIGEAGRVSTSHWMPLQREGEPHHLSLKELCSSF